MVISQGLFMKMYDSLSVLTNVTSDSIRVYLKLFSVTDAYQQRWVMSKNLINNLTKLDSLMKTSGNLEPRLASLCDSMSSLKLEAGNSLSARQRMTAEWTGRSLASLAPRHQTKPGECSVYSCLNSFTQCELLTGSNKWACQACTDQSRQDNSDTSCGDKKATVYSPASKQLLIFCPPAILTLHLKVRISSV